MNALLLSCALAAPAAPAVLARVQATYEKAGNIEAGFTQTYVDKLRGKKRVESGKLWATVDGRVRWSYLAPIRKDFVYDGDTAYFYEPENAQVTVFERFEDSQLSNAVRFLIGKGDLASVFELKDCSKYCKQGQPGDHVLALWPKETIPTVKNVLLAVDPKSYRVRTSVVIDPLGNRTEYAFNDVAFGKKISDDKFDFTPPKGVQILRATAASEHKPAQRDD